MKSKLCFIGTSHAAQHLSRAASEKGFELVGQHDADVVFVSEDTPTDENGVRDLQTIKRLYSIARKSQKTIVITSAVPPGFTRGLCLGSHHIWHQAETLRILDAEERARNPEMLIIGSRTPDMLIPEAYQEYLDAFRCPILRMTWESAEFSKVAINCWLAASVDMTNNLADAAEVCGADWNDVAEALRHDGRIGRKAYLTPGSWQNSKHLMRDVLTLTELM